MRDILTVMKFTIKDMVKRKSFIISTLIILLLIVIGFNIPNIIKSIKGDDTNEKLLIIDNEDIFEGNLELIKQAGVVIEDKDYTNEELERCESQIIDFIMSHSSKNKEIDNLHSQYSSIFRTINVK